MDLGQRIAIVGVSATGKSTFARALAEKTALPLVMADLIMWQPGWEYVGDEETAARLLAASAEDEWIIEGYLTRAAREQVFRRAHTVIHLDYARQVAARRYLQRWLKHRKNPRPELPRSPESFSVKFLKLVWDKAETRSLDPHLEEARKAGKLVRLETPRAARDFLAAL